MSVFHCFDHIADVGIISTGAAVFCAVEFKVFKIQSGVVTPVEKQFRFGQAMWSDASGHDGNRQFSHSIHDLTTMETDNLVIVNRS